jgi:tRNA U54 and U55 pseudouridine synthase Pus10
MIRPNRKSGEWMIYYTDEFRRGITWTLRYNVHSGKYKEYLIEARINPKLLAGIKDYITASTSDYLQVVEERFNEEVAKISEILGKFHAYDIKRVDFCINFDLKELRVDCANAHIIFECFPQMGCIGPFHNA